MSDESPTTEELKTFVHYNPSTGILKRIARKSWTGSVVPCCHIPTAKTAYGYLQLNIFGRPHAVHRLIFLYMKGRFPDGEVDHINGDRTDNRWSNLREVSRQENLKNCCVRSDNTSGHPGISYRKDIGKYFAYIWLSGKRKGLGNYDSFSEALVVRKKAEAQFGFHENHGRRRVEL